MKKFLFSLAALAGFSLVNAQVVLFEDDFESYEDFSIGLPTSEVGNDNVGDWIMIDVDGAPTYSVSETQIFANQYIEKAWMVFNPAMSTFTNSDGGDGETRNFDTYSGQKYMAAWASVDVQNNDWMISPAITLGSTGNKVEFQVKALSNSYGPEEFALYVYEGDGIPTPDDMEWLDQDFVTNWQTWNKFEVDLDYYANSTIRIGIQCISDDSYMLMVDDFKVTTDALGLNDLNRNNTLIYPNPAKGQFNVNFASKLNQSNVKVSLNDMTGKVVKTFGAEGNYNISELPKGVYVVTITDGKTTETQKLVVR